MQLEHDLHAQSSGSKWIWVKIKKPAFKNKAGFLLSNFTAY